MTTNRNRNTSGFTLVEVLVATVIVGLSLAGSTWTMAMAAGHQSTDTEVEDVAAHLAHELHQLAQSLPKEPSGTVAVTSAADVVALDCLSGARFSPPLLGDGRADDTLSGWSQEVSLKVFDVASVGVDTGDSIGVGLTKVGTKVFGMSVTIKKDGAVVDTFESILAP